MKTLWYAFLDLLLGGWMASGTIPAEQSPDGPREFSDWSREPDHFEQAKVLLADEAAWFDWFKSFTPDALIEPQGESRESLLYDAPASFPCVVIATRRLGSGLVRADFYWDFVYPEDFPAAAPDYPSALPSARFPASVPAW